MQHHTAGWIVNQLAELQEELHNTDCADILRSIVADRQGVPYVVSETSFTPGQRVAPASVITRAPPKPRTSYVMTRAVPKSQ